MTDLTADYLDPSRGRCLVARAPLSRGDVALEDAPVATAADESGLLVRCFSSAEARRVVDGLCTLDGEALAPEARSELRAHVAEAATTLEFGAMASDDGDDAPGDDDDEFDDGDGGGWAWRAALRLECNTFTRWSARYEREELGVFPRATRLNHSCDPNLVREQAPPADGAPRFALRFTALRDIAAGEELCFSYVPVTLARAPRRDLLRRHFGFDCACARCREGDDAADAARGRALGHAGCDGSWNASGACAICGARREADAAAPDGAGAVLAPAERVTLSRLLGVQGARERVLFHVPPRALSTCRAFRAVADHDGYWRVRLAVAMAPGAARGVVREWRNDERGMWFCYWDGSFGMPRDRAKDYVFRPPLEMTRHGVVHARASDLAGGAPAREVCRHLKSLKEVLRLSGSRYGYVGLGDESGAEWMPLLLPWSASGDGEFKPENVLKKLGAHPHLQQHCQDNEFAALRAFEAVSKVPIGSAASPTLHFSAGRDALNPVPCFAVRLVRDDLAVGFIGGIVLT